MSYLPKGGTYRRLEIYLSYKRQNKNNNIIKFYPKKNMNSIINSLKLKISKISNTNNKSRDFNDDPYETLYVDPTDLNNAKNNNFKINYYINSNNQRTYSRLLIFLFLVQQLLLKLELLYIFRKKKEKMKILSI